MMSYQIVSREYREPYKYDEGREYSVETEGFAQGISEEEFLNNREDMHVEFETCSMSEAVQTMIDSYAKAYVRRYGNEVRIEAYALYNTEFDEFIAFADNHVEPYDYSIEER